MAEELSLAFCMGSHARLGKNSPIFDTLNEDAMKLITHPIVEEERCKDACAKHLGIMFPCRNEDVPTQIKVGNILETVKGRILSKVGKEDTKLAGIQGTGNLRLLTDVVWEIREKVQDPDCEEDTFYIELDNSCRLLSFDEFKSCSAYDDSPTFSENEEHDLKRWDHPAHLFMPLRDEKVSAHAHDLLEHIRDDAMDERIPSILAEALILQACVFPFAPFGLATEAEMGSEMCPITRMTCVRVHVCDGGTFKFFVGVDVKAGMGGRLIKLMFRDIGEDDDPPEGEDCKCLWCSRGMKYE